MASMRKALPAVQANCKVVRPIKKNLMQKNRKLPSPIDSKELLISGHKSIEYVKIKVQLPVTQNEGLQKPMFLRAKIGQTLLQAAQANSLNVDGTCAGDLNCSTCHCVLGSKKVFENSKKLSALTTREEDLLDSAWDVQNTSRLSCQVVVTGEMDGMLIRFPNVIDGNIRRTDDALGRVSETNLSENVVIPAKKFQNITKSSIRSIFEKHAADNTWLHENVEKCVAIAEVLPFRTNNYVVDDLIDWSNVPNDPMFQLNFPQPTMLSSSKDGSVNILLNEIIELQSKGIKGKRIRERANKIRKSLNPHPAKQQTMNVPSVSAKDTFDDLFESPTIKKSEVETTFELEKGMQHKYRETVLFFPSEAQYCHSYCTYCFRWPQFVGFESWQFASNKLESLLRYLRTNKNVTDLLMTGGDPMVMNSEQLRRYIMAIVDDPELEHVQTIRFGSKSLAYWPHKYVNENDSDAVLQVFKDAVDRGKHVSFMAHFTHPAELKTDVVKEAIRRIRATGVVIRSQAPVVCGINDSVEVWTEMWRQQVRLGIVPYYMFVERDTGAMEHFGMPLEKCLEIYNGAIQNVSGLARTARGPSMSCTPGKVAVQGIETVAGQKVFILKFLQARNPSWQGRVFFAEYDPKAMWISDLKPAFGESKFFFEEEHDELERLAIFGKGSSGQIYNLA